MAFCSACGTQMADNAAFCPKCGKAAGQAAAPEAPSAASPGSTGTSGTTAAPAAPMAENVAGMLAYFTIIPAIIFLLIEPYNRNRFVRFHSFQCLFTAAALIVLHIVLSIFGYIVPVLMFGLWGLVGLAELALWILLIVKAYQHEMFKLPIVGDLAEKQAGA
ncbi:MAG TPA: zinc-ribbon domain-containing protein [Terriglobales bacterium]|nr:zinc-ribbon domain-containing protein [Terriglobales bacterium]